MPNARAALLWTHTAERPFFAEGRPSAKMGLDRGLLSVEGPTLGEEAFAEGRSLPRTGPRQKYPLPSARNPALGKINDPR